MEALHCHHCNAILMRINLARLEHVDIKCEECGEWSEFDYEPTKYVYKHAETPDAMPD